jgi:hypothetical protein
VHARRRKDAFGMRPFAAFYTQIYAPLNSLRHNVADLL